MLCSLIADLIVLEVEYGECLFDVCVNVFVMKRRSVVVVTSFVCRAVAMCCAPCGPIRLLWRSSVVSVCFKSEKKWRITE